jgi:preprotein translocase subunit YajC
LLTSTTSDSASTLSLLASMLPIVLAIVLLYFMLIRPQNKREKESTKMRNNLQVGDEIVTAGGIVGRVVSLREDTLLIETGSNNTKIRIKRWAVQSCETVHDDV